MKKLTIALLSVLLFVAVLVVANTALRTASITDLFNMTSNESLYYCSSSRTLNPCVSLQKFDTECVMSNANIIKCDYDWFIYDGPPEYNINNTSPSYDNGIIKGDCGIEQFKDERIVNYTCTSIKTNYSNCLNYHSSNNSCSEYEKIITDYNCPRKEKFINNKTVCDKSGVWVDYLGKNYSVTGCCAYFSYSPYRAYEPYQVISCKQPFGSCDTPIQQSSSNFSEFDEEGIIYVFKDSKFEVNYVGLTEKMKDKTFSEVNIK